MWTFSCLADIVNVSKTQEITPVNNSQNRKIVHGRHVKNLPEETLDLKLTTVVSVELCKTGGTLYIKG